MGDDSCGSLEGKSLSNLRVVDLKLQLEKRGLSKSGSKKELVKRLKQKLELEKLYEESAAIGDSEPKLHLDEATEQNEFVKQYLAEQQKIYARQKEVKRLIELKEHRGDDEEETDSDACNKDQDSDVSESVSIAKNNCDSSTHAEGGEEEEETKSSEGGECSTTQASREEPESSTEGDPLPYASKVEPIDQSESSHSQSSMDSANPDSAISYSLSDIQLPDSPKKLSKVLVKPSGSDSETNAVNVHLAQEGADVNADRKANTETNGTSDVDENSNLSKRSSSPERDPADEVSEEQAKVTSLCDLKGERTVEPMETDSLDGGICLERASPRKDQDKVENSTEEQAMETEDVSGKSSNSIERSDDRDVQEADSTEKELVDIPDVACVKPKRDDIEEGETDVDTESEEDASRSNVNRDADMDSRTEKEVARPVSPEPAKPVRSPPRERTLKRISSSSSDSSSSDESVPKRKSYGRSKDHSKSDHGLGGARHSPSRRSHKDESLSRIEEMEPKPQVVADKPRRLKIKRSTPIIITPVVPEPKKEVSRRHHKKIEMTSEVEESKPVNRTSSADGKITLSKKEHTPKKRPAEESPVDVVPPKVTYRKLNVPFRKSEENKEKSSERKHSWNSYTGLTQTAVSISTDSLKSLIPDFKVVCSPSILSDTEEKAVKASFEQVAVAKATKSPTAMPLSEPRAAKVEKTPSIEEPKKPKRRDSIKESPSEPMEVEEHHKRTVLPEKPRSKILFIRNLVRPFTLLQLKEVLKQTGTIVEDGFWIDKIKSKCLVTYETEEQASKTREALHNTRWPASNPKILTVEYATKEDFETYKNDGEETKPSLPVVSQPPERPPAHIPASDVPRKKEREEKERPKDRERSRKPVVYVREWDKDKLSQDSPEREDRRHSSKPAEKRRSSERENERKERGRSDSVKESTREERDVRKKHEEDTPAKLLDDLFQKTKATPCIYWLPLTEEQVKQKEEERRLRRLEREKRNQEQEEAERTRRKPREKDSRSRTRSPARRR